jgi:hypothetical protein
VVEKLGVPPLTGSRLVEKIPNESIHLYGKEALRFTGDLKSPIAVTDTVKLAAGGASVQCPGSSRNSFGI